VLGSASQLSGQNVTAHQIFVSGSVRVDRCAFVRVKDGGAQGGAIYTTVPLTVTRSFFHKCEATQGGGIFSSSHVAVSACEFQACRARASGGIDLRNGDRPDASIVQCNFLKDRADLFAVLFRMSKGNFVADSCNGTKTRADQCVGFMEAKFGCMEIRFITVVGASAGTHNGALCVRLLDQLLIEHCVFVNVSHCTSEHEAAAVLLCYENAYDSLVTDCAFLWTSPNASYTIHVLTGGHLLVLERCCFTGTKERELAPRLIRLVETQFEQAECTVLTREPAVVTEEEEEAVEEAATELPTKQDEAVPAERETIGGIRAVAHVTLCALVSLVVASVVTGGQIALRNRWNDAVKNPKAIL
jgi:hypothetical protein